MAELDQSTYDRLAFAARVSGLSIGQIVKRLVDDSQGAPAVEPRSATGPSSTGAANFEPPSTSSEGDRLAMPNTSKSLTAEVPVYANYLGRRIEGVYLPNSNEIRVTSGPMAGRLYPSPSSAAIAVVEALNPGREHSNTNGRTFWNVGDTGQPLRSIIGRR
jgi:hypothetical protein